MNENSKLKEILDELSKGAAHIISTPDTIQQLIAQDLPIENKFIRYEDYIEELFAKKKEEALSRARQLPQLDQAIANGVIAEIYQDVRDSYILGVFPASIMNSLLLLEYSMRVVVYAKRLKSDPNTLWADMEKLDMDNLIKSLYKLKLLTEDEQKELKNISETLRNPYFHINIHKLTKDIVLERLQGVNIHTLEKIELKNVSISEHQHLWFAGKRFFDKFQAPRIIEYCVFWANKLLASKNSSKVYFHQQQ